MIQITPQMRILVACKAVDFRKGIDGLAQICRDVLKADPFSGYLFVFRNKRATAIKILVYDGQSRLKCCYLNELNSDARLEVSNGRDLHPSHTFKEAHKYAD